MHDYFKLLAKNYLKNRIEVPIDDIEAVKEYVKRLVPNIMKREKYKNSNPKQLEKSWTNGTIAEVGLEKYTKTKFVNFEIRKETDPDKGDLYYYENLKIGVKTAEFGNVPVVYRNDRGFGCTYPEVITIFERPNFIYVCGYASVPLLNYYQDIRFAFGDAVYKKSGFWGFHKLHNFTSMNDLKNLNNNILINTFNGYTDKPEDYGYRPSVEEINITFDG